MIRKPPTAVTLTPVDIESFKKITGQKKENNSHSTSTSASNSPSQILDNVFQGRAIEREQDLTSRLGIE